ncbi:cryptochrome/photolyase family protein [Rhodococcus sp. NBC_00297]|uniref:cryptochrome/photolyase family protein n=1 Tax=Rhodococcus sp. NBC_00297 TaxID=2976005 RepID=UPI002E29B786|nr:cryptochrome/photolyase family protein [Rhodococcus sp. NBC_00297]
MSSPAPLWVFADQLGPHVHSSEEMVDRDVVIIESARAFGRRRGHRQKAHLLLSGMRHLADELGDRATYIRADTYREGLARVGRPVVVHEPTSRRAEAFVRRLADEGLVEEIVPTPTFALSRADFADWAGGKKSFLMENFYREQRRRFDILMDGENPVSGTWNLDAENREKPPKKRTTLGVPEPWWPEEDDIDAGVRKDLDAMDVDWSGEDGPRLFAVTAAEAASALETFVATRLATFGPYEDAVMAADWTMSHSLLSVPFNLGVLHPLDAARAAEQAYRDGTAPLASVEGFVRQILGWREYVWHLYWHLGEDYMRTNALDADTPLPGWFQTLDAEEVTAACLSDALAGVHDRGWVHHIPRLMILGNHALQRGYDPRALTRWFTEHFVDGYEWVMPVNVFGMSQHADGGVIATKPYTSGGAYIDRMTDHCKGCAFDPKKRVGEDACPFTAGYWAFTHKHRERLAKNMRTRRAVSSMERLGDIDEIVEQERHRTSF